LSSMSVDPIKLYIIILIFNHHRPHSHGVPIL